MQDKTSEERQALVDSFLDAYGDRYEEIVSKEALRDKLLSLSASQLASFIADASNGFDFADLEETEGGAE